MDCLRPPSARLQQRIRAWIDEWEDDDSLGQWPRRLMRERGAYLLHGNQAYLWYLTPDGAVFYVDTDRYGNPFEPETDLPAAVNAVAQAARSRPELREMLPERPAQALDCSLCRGTGDEDRWGKCKCAGLGWVV